MSVEHKKQLHENMKEQEELKKQIQGLKETITERANKIVHEIMPQKAIDLNKLFLENPKFNIDVSEVRKLEGLDKTNTKAADNTAKKRKISGSESVDVAEQPHAEIPPNKVIGDLLVILKKEILQLIEMINTVKIWIQLNIPRIEDGNNFGVSIQEETVGELARAEDAGFSVLENMTKYFVTRAKLVTKALKHPHIDDYRQSVMELDEKQFINLRLCALDLRNNYTILHDMIIKNLEKLKTPRSSHHMNAIF